MQQGEIFDKTGRIAAKLGLAADYEVVVSALEAAHDFHAAFRMYQEAIISCEMARMGSGDRAKEMSRFWHVVAEKQAALGGLLERYEPTRSRIADEIEVDLAREKREKEAAEKAAAGEKIDGEVKDLLAGGMPPAAPDAIDSEFQKLIDAGMPGPIVPPEEPAAEGPEETDEADD